MKYTIEKLDRDVWKETCIPVAWTSEYYYDITVDRTEDGFSIPIVKKKFDRPFFHDPNAYEYPVEGHRIWGMTAGAIRHLCAVWKRVIPK